ncbi:DUF3558 family protein [Rhodococcus sp. NPDC058514]|uniref:DUF3558 family protein n=1 Tax=unclassified Rhodococcus (in: high G+C Gram-positive bacteria) TaxID=192944 RepID=UPI0036513583
MTRLKRCIAIGVGACALATGCATDSPSIDPVASVREADPCTLLTTDEVAILAGTEALKPMPDSAFERISDCEWGADAGSVKVRLIASSLTPGVSAEEEAAQYDHEVLGRPALVIADDWSTCLYEVSFSDLRMLQLTAKPTVEMQRANPTTFGDTTCDRTRPVLEKAIERLDWS